jgi:hypothetical protein
MKHYLILLIFFWGCGAQLIDKHEVPQRVVVKEVPKHDVEELLAKIPAPEAPKRIFAVKEGDCFRATDKSKATHTIFSAEEYLKIDLLVTRTVGFKNIIIEQGNLVNSYIDRINSLGRLYSTEEELCTLYYNRWVESENAYRVEAYNRKIDNIINRTFMYVITIGSIILLIFG